MFLALFVVMAMICYFPQLSLLLPAVCLPENPDGSAPVPGRTQFFTTPDSPALPNEIERR